MSMNLNLIAATLSLLIVAGPALAAETTKNGITVYDPWARATPRGAQAGSAYMVIRAAPDAQDRLVGAYGDVAKTIELHSYTRDGGVMRMAQVPGITIGPGELAPLVPGGYHIMLSNLTQPLRDGDRFKLTLVFERVGEMIVDVEVAAVAATTPRGGYTVPGFVGAPGIGPGILGVKGSY
jgi:copper(I)-binding protein